jgi:hypothetical protein
MVQCYTALCVAIRKRNLIQNLLAKAFQRNEMVSSDLSNIQWRKLDICCFLFTSSSLLQFCIHGYAWMGNICESVATTAIIPVTKTLSAARNPKEKHSVIYVSVSQSSPRGAILERGSAAPVPTSYMLLKTLAVRLRSRSWSPGRGRIFPPNLLLYGYSGYSPGAKPP